jgi:hypothetical protein
MGGFKFARLCAKRSEVVVVGQQQELRRRCLPRREPKDA